MSFASLIGGALGLISNMHTSYVNQSNVENTNASNRQAVERQNQLNLEQWQRENAYNAPINQIQRLRAAGLNPGIMYGSEGVVNSSAPSPAMQSSRDVPPQSTFQVDPLTVAQIANLNAQTRKTDAEADTEEQIRQSRIDNINASTANLVKQNDKIVQEIENLVKSGKLTDKQIEQFKFDNVMRGKEYMLDVKRLQNETNLTNQQIKQMKADVQKTLAEKRITDREYNEMVWTYAIRKSGLANSVNLSAAQIEQARATASKLGIETQMNELSSYANQTMLSNMKGENGFGNMVASHAAYAIERLISQFGAGLFK